jgi:hypothetical protein
MDASTTAKHTRSEQCRKNAQTKSEQKRQATFAAIRDLQHEKHPVTRSAVARRAGISVVFLRSHLDLLQAMEEAGQQYRLTPPESAGDKTKDQVIAALRRRLDEMKQQLATKDQALVTHDERLAKGGSLDICPLWTYTSTYEDSQYVHAFNTGGVLHPARARQLREARV